MNVTAQDTVKPDTLYYFTRGPQKFELMSFVTPYGIGVDLGKTGKMWEFDVTDYLPIMKGWHRLTMERGSGQEEFDLKFLFIKGTPTRNVIDLDQLLAHDRREFIIPSKPISVISRSTCSLNPAARGYKIRSTTSRVMGKILPIRDWMESSRRNGTTFLSIPHSTAGSSIKFARSIRCIRRVERGRSTVQDGAPAWRPILPSMKLQVRSPPAAT